VGVPEDRELAHVRLVTRVLDTYGLDPILGFIIPELGDLIGALLGLYVVIYALRHNMSKALVARMVLNLGIDMAIGAVPILGDLADIGFKANERNLKLVESREANSPARRSDWIVLVGAFAGFFALIGLLVYAVVRIVGAIAGAIF
jgi:hypothetical protein